MSGHKDREKSRAQAREANVGRCPNCGERKAHFVPPSMGEQGFFICSPAEPKLADHAFEDDGIGLCALCPRREREHPEGGDRG